MNLSSKRLLDSLLSIMLGALPRRKPRKNKELIEEPKALIEPEFGGGLFTETIDKSRTKKIILSHSDLIFNVHYPDDNPDNFLEEITNTMRHIGLFDSVSK